MFFTENRIPFYLTNSVNRILLEKLIVIQLVKKFPASYRTQRFITAFTRTHTDPRPCVTFCNKLAFYGDELLAPHPTPKLEDLLVLYELKQKETFHQWVASLFEHIVLKL
jgi:hypothetical protein